MVMWRVNMLGVDRRFHIPKDSIVVWGPSTISSHLKCPKGRVSPAGARRASRKGVSCHESERGCIKSGSVRACRIISFPLVKLHAFDLYVEGNCKNQKSNTVHILKR